ncbi:hypothetical protein [Streptomyces sp. NPDC000229]|uniref:hypothetical protein n=1 Tax=Streptomyces sp. NPDC000229 TaxID=3154247 RepID=UPI004037B90D
MTREPVELVIFDCDGILVDSERTCVRVGAEIFAYLGVSFTQAEIVELFVGSSSETYTAIVAERLAGEGVVVFDDMRELAGLVGVFSRPGRRWFPG